MTELMAFMAGVLLVLTILLIEELRDAEAEVSPERIERALSGTSVPTTSGPAEVPDGWERIRALE